MHNVHKRSVELDRTVGGSSLRKEYAGFRSSTERGEGQAFKTDKQK